MLEPQPNPGAVRNRKRVNADLVDATTPETPVIKKKTKPTPPAVPAAASPRVTRAANQRAQGEQAVAQGQLEAAQHKEAADHREAAPTQGEQDPPHGHLRRHQVELPTIQGEGLGSQGNILEILNTLALH